MDLDSPLTLIRAWLLVPALVATAAAGLGLLLARAAGRPLGALTLPAGYLTGIALMTAGIEARIPATVVVIACVLLALGGLVPPLARRVRSRRSDARAERAPTPARAWAALCALGAYAVAMAPLATTGRSGVLGYVLNNDSAAHISAVQLLRSFGTEGIDTTSSSFHYVGTLFSGGYPIGSHVWPLFGTVASGTDPFHLWIPLAAVSAAMTALVGFALLRDIEIRPSLAAVGGATIASGFLPFSYLVQGGAKEVATALSVYGTLALFMWAVRQGYSLRTLLPTSVGLASGVAILGLGVGAWFGLAALVAGAALLIRPPPGLTRLRTLGVAALAAVIGGLIAIPAAVASLDFVRASEDALTNPAEVGNLLDTLPWYEAFNLWFAYDYRYPEPTERGLTLAAIAVAAPLALAGVLHALHRRRLAIPLAVVTGAGGAIFIARRYSIYFDAKAYMVLAPALGLATAAGLAWLYRVSVRTQGLALALAAALSAGVLLADGLAHEGTWMTPGGRFEELSNLNEEFEGQGPILVNEREHYAKYLLRDVEPWNSWETYFPSTGFYRLPQLDSGHTPDFDDYRPEHLDRFKLLLERKRPGGSLPPSAFRQVEETEHYRVWRRAESAPTARLPLGVDQLSGAAKLDCDRPEAREFLRIARSGTMTLRVARPGAEPIVAQPIDWTGARELGPGPTDGFLSRIGGQARADVPALGGRQKVYIQGSFSAGVAVYVNGKPLGQVSEDLGLFDAWQELGEVDLVGFKPTVIVSGLEKHALRPGSRRADISGALAFERQPVERRIEEMGVSEFRSLCGQKLDWVEAVAPA